MIKNILQIYALSVCLVTTLILMTSLFFTLNIITNLLIPQYKYASSLHSYESNDQYIQYYENHCSDPQHKKLTFLKQLSPAQLDEKKALEKKQFLEDKKADDIAYLITTLQWILVASLFFVIHWRIYKKSK